MALIRCGECGKEISSTATVCPHCGCKTSWGQEQGRQINTAIIGIIFYVMSFIFFVIGIWKWMDVSDYQKYLFLHEFEIREDVANSLMFIVIAIAIDIGTLIGLRILKSRNKNLNIQMKYAEAAVNKNVWNCACGMNNPLNRTICVACGRPRGNTPEMPLYQGMWHCYNCGRNNPNQMVACACGMPKPEQK